MTYKSNWISEKWRNVEILYRLKSVLHDQKTDFQHLKLVDTYEYGRMLLLDGIVQTTENDEFVYHEMMVHVPMLSHPDPRRVLIIGGGDGGILREVLRYSFVEKATIVEIDSQVIDLCKEYLPSLSKGAFYDSRTDLVVADGAEYVKETDEKFDVVIVDSPDPIGPARVLFSERFYSNIHRVMNKGGIMVCQTGSTQLQPEEQKAAYKRLKKIFLHTTFYVYAVPTYVGGLFSSAFCSDSVNTVDYTIENLQERFTRASIETLYYNPGLHLGAFHIPHFLKKRIQ